MIPYAYKLSVEEFFSFPWALSNDLGLGMLRVGGVKGHNKTDLLVSGELITIPLLCQHFSSFNFPYISQIFQ